ncbi:ubiquitin-conjugating enzyme E2 Q2 [Purpureocillium lavendulum]|uniref:Ubiquitin-conjugating enzyme E2 Q2 n=1 Tax=Purpureocillium lavendulum TaxID=1247861 RepID=A0AB34FSX8_9HYPO|nr:ubiquitin-conjugating enzyme E2 Q2 [Purpureocillium lavendulum]
MASKKFYADLAVAKTSSYRHISKIRRGELGDGIGFTFSDGDTTVDVELVIRDISSYTDDASFVLITSSDSPSQADVAEALEALSRRIPVDGTIVEILGFLSVRLPATLSTPLGDEDAVHSSDFDDASMYDVDYTDEWDGPHAVADESTTRVGLDSQSGGAPKAMGTTGLRALSRALYKAKAASLLVGLIPAERGQAPRFVSLAIRVSVLGIAEDVLEAWGLKPAEYLVLLIYFANGYPDVGKYQALPEQQLDVQYRFGKCVGPKLSQDAASNAFFGTHNGTKRASAFLPNHMSRPINPGRDHQVRPTDLDNGPIITTQAPEALQVDYALDEEDEISSLKPYVCEKPLCLYQYMSLGFGPSIEHEIINNPLVVDLLVSFLFAAITYNKIREFPSALAVKVPNLDNVAQGDVVKVNQDCEKWAGDDLELLAQAEADAETTQEGKTTQSSATPSALPGGGTGLTSFAPRMLEMESIPKLPAPSWASSSPQALQAVNREVKDLHRIQSKTAYQELGWTMDMEGVDNLFHWIVELHSFDTSLPLGQDMMRLGVQSVVLEIRFGASFPMSPPFVRVVRPRFLPFSRGGGGHVTAGGAICSELLTNSGWSPALSMEKVFLQVRLGLCELDPPARLDPRKYSQDYGIMEAVEAYKRAALVHGWRIPPEMADMTAWL